VVACGVKVSETMHANLATSLFLLLLLLCAKGLMISRISMKFIYELQLGAQSFERALLKHTPNGHLLALN